MFSENFLHVYNSICSCLSPTLPPPPPTSATHSSQSCNFSIIFLIIHRVEFVLTTYSWYWGHSLECGQPTNCYILKENLVLPPAANNSQQFLSYYGARELLSTTCWDVNWLDHVQARTASRHELMSAEVLSCAEITVSHQSSLPLTYSLSTHSSWIFPGLGVKEYSTDAPLTHILFSDQLEVSLLSTVPSTKNFPR